MPALLAALAGACSGDETPSGDAGGSAGEAGVAGGPGSGDSPEVVSRDATASFFDWMNCVPRETPDAPPAGGVEALGGLTNVYVASGLRPGSADATAPTAESASVPDARVAGAIAYQVTTVGTPDNFWDAQVQRTSASPVAEGDVVLVDFWARCLKSEEESNECGLAVDFQKNSPDWDKSLNFATNVNAEWTHIFIPFTAKYEHPAGEATLNINAAYPDQTLQVSELSVVNYGSSATLEDLPSTVSSYEGLAADAPWRRGAAARIEAHRKSDLTVKVVDGSGMPVEGASIRVAMQQHTFQFGSAISTPYLEEGPATDPEGYARYEEVAARLFNVVTPENAFKWLPIAGDWGPAWGIDRALAGVQWAEELGIPSVRGHVLVWPSWKHLPGTLKDAWDTTGDKEALQQAVLDHIVATMTSAKGRLVQWDVMNEPFDNHDLMDILGEDAMAEWFKKARETDETAQLFVNDYAILSGGGGDSAHRQNYERVIGKLIDDGAPLDGIGMQGHFGQSLTAPDDLEATLDRFAAFDRDIVITEYDIAHDDADLAACYTHDFMTSVFAHEQVTGFVMWGFWDGRHWKSAAPLYDIDWNLKPSGRVFEELTRQRWWTDESGVSNASGAFAVRGFHGVYEVTASKDGRTGAATLTLDPTVSEVTVTLQ